MSKIINPSLLESKARILLADVLQISLQEVYLLNQVSLDEQQEKVFFTKKERLDRGCPLEYLLSKIDFLDLQIKVFENVFIPRPETEEWVRNLLDKVKHHSFIVDMCSGTGVIGLSFAKAFSGSQIVCVDFSDIALDNINYNKNLNNINNVEILKSDLFTNKDLQTKIIQNSDWVLFCNPPYVPEDDKQKVQKNNIGYEPENAIFAKQGGLQVFYNILDQLINLNLPNLCVFELDPRNIREAEIELKKYYSDLVILCDFEGRERVLIGVDKKVIS